MLQADVATVPCPAQELWKSRKPPTPLRLEELVPGAGATANGWASDGGGGGGAEASACEALGMTDAHRLWSVAENARVRAHLQRTQCGC